MTHMRPSSPLQRAVFAAIDKVAALLGASEPLHWLTMPGRNPRRWRSEPVDLYEIDGRTYLMDIYPSRGWVGRMSGRTARGTLTTGRSSTDVTLTEVTDPVVKHQVLIAYAGVKPNTPVPSGKRKRRKHEPILVALRIAPDDTAEGLAAAVPRVAVFEVTPT